MTLSIIIPIFNEEKTVGEILKKVLAVKVPIEKEIIVVDDGSTDKSKSKIKRFFKLLSAGQKSKNIKLIYHDKNMGKGAAIRSGLKVANGEIIIIQDADLEYDPRYYPTLIKPILQKKAKIVYGTRLKKYPLKLWGKNKTVLPIHLIANKFLTGFTNLLYNSKLTDMETCYKVFMTECLIGIELKSNRFEFEPEITAKFLKKGYKIFEVPINVTPRTYEEGKKIGFRDGIRAVWTILKYKFVD